ncbi:MAG TPA: tRNA (adenosine(37)-N6)-dimethylallyltransferase MiaA [Thermoanaerobaculia bacterium]|nr:tRNA (adenosine(37)-N6)-dimethylallyltransferase MiaA [Thermoanaerobaculia bacterium]
MSAPWVVIAGPTGTGKSELAVAIAERLDCEIVNYDSVQIYRGFDIGSAKPDAGLRARVPHHLYDTADPRAEWNAAEFAELAERACAGIESRGRRPLLVGGTGFWLRALLAGLPEMPPRDETVRRRLSRLLGTPRGAARAHRWLTRVDPAAAAKIAPADRHRIERALEVWMLTRKPISARTAPGPRSPRRPSIVFAIRFPRDLLIDRLDARVEAMYAAGLVEETGRLLARYGPDARPFGSIGYAEAAAVVAGAKELSDAIEETKRRTRAYAKRQMTWLRAEQDVHWLDAPRALESLVEEALAIVRYESPRENE